MPTSQYLPFCTGTGANGLTPSAYAALTVLIAQGFQTGVAPSIQVNTVLRQATVGVAGVANFAITYGPDDVPDDGNPATFSLALKAAIDAIISSSQFWKTGDIKSKILLPTMSAIPAADPGFIYLNGANVSRTGSTAALWAYFGNPNTGDGSTTWTLPDLRGVFLRGDDNGRGLDPDGTRKGAQQASMVQKHKHVMAWGDNAGSLSTAAPFGYTSGSSYHGAIASDENNPWFFTNDGTNYDNTVNAAGVIGTETRPVNVSVAHYAKL